VGHINLQRVGRQRVGDQGYHPQWVLTPCKRMGIVVVFT
jgi:hypothetical protein